MMLWFKVDDRKGFWRLLVDLCGYVYKIIYNDIN